MKEQEKPLAYYKRVVFNSLKNEFRSNANAAKRIFPAGSSIYDFGAHMAPSPDEMLSKLPPGHWLMF